MIIAIDGPAGAGKSTVAKRIARKLGFLYIDTGAMYRALTLKVLEEKIGIEDAAQIIHIASGINICLLNNPDGSLKVLLDGKDVTTLIRQPRITKFVSDIAKIRAVRECMVKLQRELGTQRDSVLDGRDIGTVVFPQAEKKFYLDADFKERVSRRHKELIETGLSISAHEVDADLKNRDTIDSTREVGPLRRAQDAVYLDTSNLTIEEVVQRILSYIHL